MSNEILMVSVDDLRFDPENPRIPPHVDARDDQAVLDWMLEDAGLVELMGSIAAKGFFPAEPLLVTAAEGGSGWIVLEGNRRLAAVMLLLEPDRAPRRKAAVRGMAEEVTSREQLAALPCAIFGDRSDVLDYLGYRHITGIKQWEPVAKARYLAELYNAHKSARGDEVYRYIARLIGSRQDYVRRLLGALALHEEIRRIDSLKSIEVSFSLFTLALNYASIVKYLEVETLDEVGFGGVNRSHLKDVAEWLFVERPVLGRTQLGDSRNMRLLAAAVSEPSGVQALERGEAVEQAALAAISPRDVLGRNLKLAGERLVAAQATLHEVEIDDIVMADLERILNLVEQMQLIAARRLRRKAIADA
ncbi:hypothetical protein [Cellulomonas endophytica]|uniref:hypothetical protein n=1 Tax=Cellulomonas endophytica TaxID=2494735 RepID=UPI0010112BF2|nr:hypothetical protein [Cellulomonas endophytica]